MTRLFPLILLLVLLQAPVGAQEELMLSYPAPEDWKKEVIALPPDFAPDLSWKGKECLRFAPGMFKAEAPDFFSYTFSLVLEEPIAQLEGDLMVYYVGLAKAVMKNPQLDTSWFKLKRTRKGHYTLYWLEPFATKKPQYLYLQAEQFDDRGRIWFICASPRPAQDPIWEKLHLYRRAARAVFGELQAER